MSKTKRHRDKYKYFRLSDEPIESDEIELQQSIALETKNPYIDIAEAIHLESEKKYCERNWEDLNAYWGTLDKEKRKKTVIVYANTLLDWFVLNPFEIDKLNKNQKPKDASETFYVLSVEEFNNLIDDTIFTVNHESDWMSISKSIGVGDGVWMMAGQLALNNPAVTNAFNYVLPFVVAPIVALTNYALQRRNFAKANGGRAPTKEENKVMMQDSAALLFKMFLGMAGWTAAYIICTESLKLMTLFAGPAAPLAHLITALSVGWFG